MATSYTHSIPTPPFSPQIIRMPAAQQPEEPLKSTINLLDSLVGFYQRERMWVYHTRARYEDAFSPPTTTDAGSAYSEASTSKVDQGFDDSINSNHSEASNGQQHTTRWHKRKKGFKLRIEGIRPTRVISTHSRGQAQKSEQLPPREQILDMYEKMMEARMESCQRLNKLVRDANRANLRYR
ncbi:hypothetical protein D9613_005341 [Agrocybe pediades]|uniref:Uncharacterized protein n=1 Tax=Agrocybe pediades TaxID=84607 RepID=A0A8H4QZ66_9AGAR|nr:hypothetical protein D9613_005341 [Agrocybe pediades]KAF9569330.1 hypothetical protein CPC08DRAFT_678009 [Agrocybe pediades]